MFEKIICRWVKQILAEHIPSCKVVAFGSRVTGPVKKYSVLDLAIMNTKPISNKTMAKLKTAFSESNLPFKVDILDWNDVSPRFRKVIEERNEMVQEASQKQDG